jgi:hypothetical protein
LADPTFSDSDPRPLYIPADTIIMYFPVLTQRNKALWGEDADEFDPERWIDPDRLKKYVSNPTMFTPFSAGPRIVSSTPSLSASFARRLLIGIQCIGQNYAYNEMSYFLVRLLQQFDRFTLAREYQPEGSLPPADWKSGKGRKTIEKIWPSSAMTLYVKVRFNSNGDGVLGFRFTNFIRFDLRVECGSTFTSQSTRPRAALD